MYNEPISPLRQRMLDAMTVRNLAEKTRHDYIRHVRNFAAFLGRAPDSASKQHNKPLTGRVATRSPLAAPASSASLLP